MVVKINLRDGFPCEITKIWSESRKAKRHSGASYTTRSKKATSVLDWRHGNELCSTEAFQWKTRGQKYKQAVESKGLFTRRVTGGTAKQVSWWNITCFFLQGIIKFPCTDNVTSIQRLKPELCSRCPLCCQSHASTLAAPEGVTMQLMLHHTCKNTKSSFSSSSKWEKSLG